MRVCLFDEYAMVNVWKSKDILWESALSFYQVGLLVIRLVGKHLYLLNHLTFPRRVLLVVSVLMYVQSKKDQKFCFMCMSVLSVCMCVYHLYVMPVEARRGCQISWNWSYRFSAAILVLGTQSESSPRAARAFHY